MGRRAQGANAAAAGAFETPPATPKPAETVSGTVSVQELVGATPTAGASGRRRRRATAAADDDADKSISGSHSPLAGNGATSPSQIHVSGTTAGVGQPGAALRQSLAQEESAAASPVPREDIEDVARFGQTFFRAKEEERKKVQETMLEKFKAESHKMSNSLKEDLEKRAVSSKDKNVRSLRFMSRARQIEEPLFKLLLMCGGSPSDARGPDAPVHNDDSGDSGTYYERVKRILEDPSNQTGHYRFGPVGEQAVHNFFLLAYSTAPNWNKSLLLSLGKRVLKDYYDDPELVSIPYISDLHTWKALGVVDQSGHPHDDGGLYTGETILHIAVANQDEDTVSWLLSKGASITARAQGSFFMPPRIHKKKDCNFKETVWTKFVAALQNRDTAKEPYLTERANEETACYFGEYLLSFATSVGNLRIMHKLKTSFPFDHQAFEPPHAEKELKETGKIGGRWDFDPSILQPTEAPTINKSWRTSWLSTGTTSGLSTGTLELKRDDFTPGVLAGSGENTFQSIDKFMNAVDSLGNTAMHLAVIHQNMNAFDWLMKNGARRSLEHLNDQGLTPLTLAAREGCVDELEHIMRTAMQSTMWSFSNVQSVMTSLEQYDTFRIKGRQSVKGSPNENSSSEHERSPVLALHDNPEFRSVLEVIVEHEVEEFAENELFNQIITEKYQHFGRRMHIRTRAIPYVLYVILHAVYVILRTREVIERTELFGLEGASVPKMLPPDVAGLYNWIGGNPQIGQNTPLFYCSRVCETGLLLWTTALFYYGWKERRLTPRDIETGGHSTVALLIGVLHKNSSFIARSLIFLCNLLSFAFHLAGLEREEFNTMAIGSVAVFMHLLEMAMPFKAAGVLITMIYRIFVGDVLVFLSIYFVFLFAFAFATFMTFQLSPKPEALSLYGEPDLRMDTHLGAVILKLAYVSFGTVDYTELIFNSHSPSFTFALHFGWILVSLVLLLNLLIAMMNGRFDEDAKNAHRLWIFPLAHTVLRYEQSLSRKLRARYRSGQAKSADKDILTVDEIEQQQYFLIQLEGLDSDHLPQGEHDLHDLHHDQNHHHHHHHHHEQHQDSHHSESDGGHAHLLADGGLGHLLKKKGSFSLQAMTDPSRRASLKLAQDNQKRIVDLSSEVDRLRVLIENRAGLRQTIMNLDKNRGGGLSSGLLQKKGRKGSVR